MSNLKKLGPNLENCIQVAAEFRADLDDVSQHLRIPGKTLEEALKEQSIWPNWYDERKSQMDTLCKFVLSRVEAVRGRLTQKFKENHSRDLSERLIEKYVNKEQEYLDINDLYIQLIEIYDLYRDAVEGFKTRGFALRDITQARIHKLEDAML